MLESCYWKEVEKWKGNQLHHLTRDTEKAFANFSPIVSINLPEYLSCKPHLILHPRSPLTNTLLFLEQISFFS